MSPQVQTSEREVLPLTRAVEFLLEECRMVLPGIQALFGFQLIATFNPTFSERLIETDQSLHLLATALVAVAVALIMTPAAIHRTMGAREITDTFIRLSTRLLLISMVPLALGIALDFYVVTLMVTEARDLSTLLATALLFVFAIFWFALPRWVKNRRRGSTLWQAPGPR